MERFGEVEQILEEPEVHSSGVASPLLPQSGRLARDHSGRSAPLKLSSRLAREQGQGQKETPLVFVQTFRRSISTNMVVPLIAQGFWGGLSTIPYAYTVLKTIPWIALVILLKVYFEGSKNRSERVMHGKVVMVTVSDAIQRAMMK